MTDVRNLRTVKQLAAESGGSFSEPAIRWLIFNSNKNGLEAALVRTGRRVRIDIEAFNAWLVRGIGIAVGDRGRVRPRRLENIAARTAKRKPDGFALVMPDGGFVGIWRDRLVAEKVRERSPRAKDERVVPMCFVD